MSSKIERKKIALNLRHYGPQPSIFVRSFSAITKPRVATMASIMPHTLYGEERSPFLECSVLIDGSQVVDQVMVESRAILVISLEILRRILAVPSDNTGTSGDETPAVDVTYLARVREELGMKARSLNPDNNQTLAILFADGEEFWGMNSEKPISFPVNSISASHAEIDALNQLYGDRQASGATGGIGLMYVDRLPCKACSLFGGIRSAVRAVKLNELTIVYGAGLDRKTGELIPPGTLNVLP